MIKVSLIVPIYNSELYLNQCIESLINQSLNEIEIILFNDGSTDESDKIIKTYNDSRIVYISKKNEGIGKTRNHGLDIAKGKYVAFIDSDDYIAEDFCEKLYDKAEKDKCDIVICDYYNFSNDKETLISLNNFNNTKLLNNPNILLDINLGPCNKIYRLKYLNENNIKFVENLKYEDVPFVCLALAKANLIGKVNEPLNYFRIHENSQTTVRNDKIFDIFRIVENIINIFSEINYKEVLNMIIISMLLDYAVQTRYISSKNIRNKFIDLTYETLEKFNSNWKKYIKNPNILKRIVLRNKTILKLYCNLYSRLRKA